VSLPARVPEDAVAQLEGAIQSPPGRYGAPVRVPRGLRTRIVLYCLAAGGYAVAMVVRLGWTGVLVMGAVLLATAALVAALLVPALRAIRRRNAELAATRPGCGIVTVQTTTSQAAQLAALSDPRRVGTAGPLVYGSAGIELWVLGRDKSLVKLLELPWSAIVDVRPTIVRNFRGTTVPGVRLTLTNGSYQDVIPTYPSELGKQARATKTPVATLLANNIASRRTAVWPRV